MLWGNNGIAEKECRRTWNFIEVVTEALTEKKTSREDLKNVRKEPCRYLGECSRQKGQEGGTQPAWNTEQ